MRVSVQYTAQLKQALGTSHDEFELESNVSLQELVSQILARHGEPFRQYALDANDQLQSTIIVCVDDEQVENAAEYQIKIDSTITLLSAISGG